MLAAYDSQQPADRFLIGVAQPFDGAPRDPYHATGRRGFRRDVGDQVSVVVYVSDASRRLRLPVGERRQRQAGERTDGRAEFRRRNAACQSRRHRGEHVSPVEGARHPGQPVSRGVQLVRRAALRQSRLNGRTASLVRCRNRRSQLRQDVRERSVVRADIGSHRRFREYGPSVRADARIHDRYVNRVGGIVPGRRQQRVRRLSDVVAGYLVRHVHYERVGAYPKYHALHSRHVRVSLAEVGRQRYQSAAHDWVLEAQPGGRADD